MPDDTADIPLDLDSISQARGPWEVDVERAERDAEQVLINVRTAPGADWQTNARLQAETAAVQDELGEGGRVLIRASGTEPLLRVMVEAGDAAQARRCAERLAASVA